MKYEVHKATWVRGEKRNSLFAPEDDPIITDDIEKFRADMIGNADNLLLVFTTYES